MRTIFLFPLLLSILFFHTPLHSAHSSASPAAALAHAHACAQSMQLLMHSAQTTSFTAAELPIVSTGQSGFAPMRIFTGAIATHLEQEVATHGRLDGATIAEVARLHAVTTHHLTQAGHPQGLATKGDVQRVEVLVMQLMTQVQPQIAPLTITQFAAATAQLPRPGTPPLDTSTWSGWFVQICRDFSS